MINSYIGSHTPSKAWLKENVEFAYFDESLWILLQNKLWRTKMHDYIIEHKLTDDSWKGKIAAEGLGIIAAVLVLSEKVVVIRLNVHVFGNFVLLWK